MEHLPVIVVIKYRRLIQEGKYMKINLYRTLSMFCLILILIAQVIAKPKSQPLYYSELSRIVNRTDLSVSQKIEKIRPYVRKQDSQLQALSFMLQIDKKVAKETAITSFHASKISLTDKLILGDFILNQTPSDDFQDEYAKFLLREVLNGEKYFMKVNEQGAKTAIGEYVSIAAGFSGYNPALFNKMKDERVIPILIRCLNAPDEVWGEQQGCLRFGNPGDSSGRNIKRQLIPNALARLGAMSAVDALKKIVYTNHDLYFRSNSVYALGRLIKTGEIDELIKKIKSIQPKQDQYYLLYYLGKGMIERGEVSRGIEFMSFKYSRYYDEKEFNSIMYMLDERLAILKDVCNPATEKFYREALTYAPLKAIFINAGSNYSEMAQKRVVDDYKQILKGIKDNRLSSLAALVIEISSKTKSKAIKDASNQLLISWNINRV